MIAMMRMEFLPTLETTDGSLTSPLSFLSSTKSESVVDPKQSLIGQVVNSGKFRRFKFPFSSWKLLKQDQWMVLHRSHVEYLQNSKEAMTAMAFLEYGFIVDEAYFAVVFWNNVDLRADIVPETKHFLIFPPRTKHPKIMTIADAPDVKKAISIGRKLFIRKVDTVNDFEMKKFLDDLIQAKY